MSENNMISVEAAAKVLGYIRSCEIKHWNYCDSDSGGATMHGWGLESQTLIDKTTKNSLRTKDNFIYIYIYICTDEHIIIIIIIIIIK
jgi:hypothetical protein